MEKEFEVKEYKDDGKFDCITKLEDSLNVMVKQKKEAVEREARQRKDQKKKKSLA